MRVLPAIDLLDNKVVRLLKGDFSKKTTYSLSPIEAARNWKTAGFSFIHIVSLDGARDGKINYVATLGQIKGLGVQIQFGGGVRTKEVAKDLVLAGVDRIMIGTTAIEHPEFWLDLVKQFGKERFVLTLDIRDGHVCVKGWTKDTRFTISDLIKKIGQDTIRHLLVTDIQKDGSMQGVSIGLYKDLIEKYPEINIIPAGGVSSIQDLRQLDEIGIKEAVMGKALYENPDLLDEIVKLRYL